MKNVNEPENIRLQTPAARQVLFRATSLMFSDDLYSVQQDGSHPWVPVYGALTQLIHSSVSFDDL